MVSATLLNANPQTMENKLLKPISLFKTYLSTLKDKKKEKAREKELIDKQSEPKQKIADTRAETVASILEPFKNLEIQTDKKPVIEDKEEDERDSFTYKVIEDDVSKNRIYSQTSEDSGFADGVTDTFDKLTLYDDETDLKDTEDKETTVTTDDTESKDENKTKETDKKKKKRKVVVARGPVKGKVCEYNAHPYANDVGSVYKPVSTI